MKKKTLHRGAVAMMIAFSCMVLLVIVPGFDFEFGVKGIGGVRKKSTEHWQKCVVMIFRIGLKYEWHAFDNPSIDGPEGISIRHGQPYLRVGNVELKFLCAY